MKRLDENNFDTDLDDDDETDQRDGISKLPRLTFENKAAVHRSNRLNETFGQINIPTESKNEILIPLRCRSPTDSEQRIRRYEKSCHILDITPDWQIRSLLSCDHINILNRSFSFNDMQAFTTAIESNLESLTLSCVGLSSRSLNILCQGLNQCVHLTLLDLSYNKINKQSFEILMNTIDRLSSLLYLSLADCSIRDSYGRRISDLCRHKRIKELNISGNEFEEMGCILFGNALTENITLRCLNLSWNLIRSYASMALFRAFEINTTLTEFDISWSGLRYDGSVALRRVLMINNVLQRLNISNCNIDWTCAKLISEGLAKNSTLNMLDLSFNPLTTHGVHLIVQALTTKKNAVTVLDLSGMNVFSATILLAQNIANRRHFVMKYDFELPVHDYLGRQQVTKADSRRTMIQQIDERKWRTLDYFRMMDNKKKLQEQNDTMPHNTSKFHRESRANTIGNLQEHFMNRLVQPFTYKNLTSVIHLQRMRDRWKKVHLAKQEKDIQERNQKILQTVTQHFPDIDIISKQDKHKQAIEQLAKPRLFNRN